MRALAIGLHTWFVKSVRRQRAFVIRTRIILTMLRLWSLLHITNASVKLNSAIDANGSRHAHATGAASTLPHLFSLSLLSPCPSFPPFFVMDIYLPPNQLLMPLLASLVFFSTVLS